MRLILLVIGTILAILFMVLMKKGEIYKKYVENLDEKEYSFCELYVVGFVWSKTKFFPLKGKLAVTLKTQAMLLYETRFAEYYANLVWAQTLTLTHLFLTLTFLSAAILYESVAFILGAGIFLSVLIAMYCMENMKNIIDKRTETCEMQLPEVVSAMAILVNSGMILREAWKIVAESGTGELYQLMQKANVDMNNGYSDENAIVLFGRTANSGEVKKFTSALLQSMERSATELGIFLAQQSSELWNMKRQKMLQSGEKAATKLLLPTVLIFIGILIVVMSVAFAGLLP